MAEMGKEEAAPAEAAEELAPGYKCPEKRSQLRFSKERMGAAAFIFGPDNSGCPILLCQSPV